MRITRQAAFTAALASLAACSGHEPTAIPAVTSSRPSMQLTGELGAVVVRGQIITPSGAGSRILTVDAMQTPSGEVHGSYRVDLTATGQFFEVAVSCVSVIGNTAWVAGHFTASNIPVIQLGSVSYFYVTDNGKPHPVDVVPADEMSIARINDALGRDVEFCTNNPKLLPLVTGVTGDIDIR